MRVLRKLFLRSERSMQTSHPLRSASLLLVLAAAACGDDDETTKSVDNVAAEAGTDAATPRDGGSEPPADGAAPAQTDARVAPELDAAREPRVEDGGTDSKAALDRNPADAAQVDASGDAGDAAVAPDTDAGTDAGSDAAPPSPRVCPASNECTLEAYPCLPASDGSGYQCRGQLAAWPAAEKRPGAKAAPKFSRTHGDGVVLDEVTGLLWELSPPTSYVSCSGSFENSSDKGCTLSEAEAYCASLTLAGGGFRLPTKSELESLLDYVTAPREQAIDPDVFPPVPGRSFWSSSPRVLSEEPLNYVVNHDVGLTTQSEPSESNAVRCVRSERVAAAPPGDRYLADTQAGTLHDQYTDLTWHPELSGALATVDAAEAYCEALGARLPSIKELLTLFDAAASANDDAFPLDARIEIEDPASLLWSSTLHWIGQTLLYQPLVATHIPESALGDQLVTEVGTFTLTGRALCVH